MIPVGIDGQGMISLRHVRKTFAGTRAPAVNDLSMEIARGETVVLVGPSGCGKTTTMRMINRLIEPTSGEIWLDGRNVLQQDPVQLRRGIGYVIQSIGLLPHRTVAQNIATVPRLVGWDDAKVDRRVQELAGLLELAPELLGRYPAELSGGQRQRVGVARALAVDPPVMLMDEPFAAVDPIVRARLQDQFVDIQERIRKTIVFVTHDIDEAIKMADRIAILNRGGVVEQFASPGAGFDRHVPNASCGRRQRGSAVPGDPYARADLEGDRVVRFVAITSWQWISGHRAVILELLRQHAILTLIAVGVGLAISLPLGVLAYRLGVTYGPITALTGLLYTIPSLALFAFLTPFTGLSTTTAEIGLVSYTLLILVRNIVVGLRAVPYDVKEAAQGMGPRPRKSADARIRGVSSVADRRGAVERPRRDPREDRSARGDLRHGRGHRSRHCHSARALHRPHPPAAVPGRVTGEHRQVG